MFSGRPGSAATVDSSSIREKLGGGCLQRSKKAAHPPAANSLLTLGGTAEAGRIRFARRRPPVYSPARAHVGRVEQVGTALRQVRRMDLWIVAIDTATRQVRILGTRAAGRLVIDVAVDHPAVLFVGHMPTSC